jgi:hypothetical protein
MTISRNDKYAIIIHEIDLHKGAPHKRFVDSLWSDFRPYPEESYPSHMERATRQVIELLIQKPGTYLVVAVQTSGELTRREGGPISWSWTVTVTPTPSPAPPPPTITWRM